MSVVQRFFVAILPERWARKMRAATEQWQIRCCTCGAARSLWEAGGIRWGATLTREWMVIRCPQCGRLRRAVVERVKK